MSPEPLQIGLQDGAVSALLVRPPAAKACYVLAHGAGAGMTHRFMADVATGLAERDIATLRFQFPYMEKGSKRPDAAAVAQGAVRAAAGEAARRCSRLPLFAGGKSFGGRMSSQAQAAEPLAGVRGLVFLGFPLHPAGKPSRDRADHLSGIEVPMLFVQGTKDKLAEMDLIEPVVAALPLARLYQVNDADHSFHVPARSGRTDREVMTELLDEVAGWIGAHLP